MPSIGVARSSAASLLLLTTGAVVGAVVVFLPWSEGDVVGLMVSGVLGLGLWWRIASLPRVPRTTVGRILVLAFVLRAVTAVAQGLFPLLPELYRLDAETYQRQAAEVAEAWASGHSPVIEASSVNSLVHVYVLGLVSLVTGGSDLAVRAVTALVGTLSIYYVYLVGRELVGDRRAAVVAGMLVAWPSHIFWTSQPFRDAWVFYFLARAVHAAVQWLKSGRKSVLLQALLFGVGVGVFRLLMGLLFLAALAAVTLLHRAYRRGVLTFGMVRPVLLALVLLGVVGTLKFAGFSYGQILTPDGVSAVRAGLATGRSPLYPDVVFSTWRDVLIFMPLGIAGFLFAPFPWQTISVVHAAAVLENVGLYALICLALVRWRRLVRVSRQGEVRFLWLLIVVSLAAYGVIEGNVGTAYRHKMQIVPWLLLVISSTWRGGVRGGREHGERQDAGVGVAGAAGGPGR